MADLTRSAHDKKVAGVCAGIARYTGLDVTLVRILTVVGTLLTASIVVPLAYAALWLLLPVEGSSHTVAKELFAKAKDKANERVAGQQPTAEPRWQTRPAQPGTAEFQQQSEQLKGARYPWEQEAPTSRG